MYRYISHRVPSMTISNQMWYPATVAYMPHYLLPTTYEKPWYPSIYALLKNPLDMDALDWYWYIHLGPRGMATYFPVKSHKRAECNCSVFDIIGYRIKKSECRSSMRKKINIEPKEVWYFDSVIVLR